MKRLSDYIKTIEGVTSPSKIVSRSSQSETKNGSGGSTIEITRQVYHFSDGVSIEYEREYDDGGGAPGCKEFWYTYKVVDCNGFDFDGKTTELFQSQSAVSRWLKSDRSSKSQS